MGKAALDEKLELLSDQVRKGIPIDFSDALAVIEYQEMLREERKKGVLTRYMRHINYLKYVLRHKWFVLIASLKIGASIWGAITHDMSKFRPSEWFPYAWTFYNADGSKRYKENPNFEWAWNDHQKRNKHHYQYWVILWDRGEYEPLEMPRRYILEMIADWMGAGRAITGQWEVKGWYEKNKDNIKLSIITRRTVESILDKIE